MKLLAELPRLSAPERAEILDRLWDLEEAAGPTEREKTLLNEAQAGYDANPPVGAPWRDVEARLRGWSDTNRARACGSDYSSFDTPFLPHNVRP